METQTHGHPGEKARCAQRQRPGVKHLQGKESKDFQPPPGTGRQERTLPQSLQGARRPVDTLTSDIWPLKPSESPFLLLQPPSV